MSRKAEAGEICAKCGIRVRQVKIPSSSISNTHEDFTWGVTCGCDDMQGPVVDVDDE